MVPRLTRRGRRPRDESSILVSRWCRSGTWSRRSSTRLPAAERAERAAQGSGWGVVGWVMADAATARAWPAATALGWVTAWASLLPADARRRGGAHSSSAARRPRRALGALRSRHACATGGWHTPERTGTACQRGRHRAGSRMSEVAIGWCGAAGGRAGTRRLRTRGASAPTVSGRGPATVPCTSHSSPSRGSSGQATRLPALPSRSRRTVESWCTGQPGGVQVRRKWRTGPSGVALGWGGSGAQVGWERRSDRVGAALGSGGSGARIARV